MKMFFLWMVETYGLATAIVWWSFAATVLLGPILISTAAWFIIKLKRSGK